ncbi:type III effector [Xanthomonas translucens pv. translucens]|uniref:XopZ family type III secretion system effector n=1 Tax=Xanthomonas campestris pv. translucens TaxID=343 RepID=UPI0021B77FBC|nr:XopZ family type III secretion system effector [Xanthomonas translucens]MCT8285736.1 type III effector [Xanthomonas translucens pv. translucens]MCT8303394.1 type III effector [Xanthomonas translucens pv. translucens]
MPKFPLRPYGVSACLPGMAETVSHPSAPSARRQTHNKLATPEPSAFEAELIAAQDEPLTWSTALLQKAEQNKPVAFSPVSADKQRSWTLPWRKAGAILGLDSGTPLPHRALLRHASSSASPVDNAHNAERAATRQPEAASPPTAAAPDLNAALLSHLEHANGRLATGIARRHADELKYAHTQTLQSARERLALLTRRACNLGDRIARLRQQRADVLRQMQQCDAQADAVSAALLDLEPKIAATRAALAAATSPGQPPRSAAPAGSPSAAAQAEADTAIAQARATLARLESELGRARSNGNALAKAVFFGRGGAQAEALAQQLTHANAELEALQRAHAQAQTQLQSLQRCARGARGAPGAASASTSASAASGPADTQPQTLRNRLVQHERMQALQRGHGTRCQRHKQRLQDDLRRVDTQLQQARQSSQVTISELWQQDRTVQALEQAQGRMEQAVVQVEQDLSTTEAQHAAAQAACASTITDAAERLLESLPGFHVQPLCAADQQTLHTWAAAMQARGDAFDSDALSPADAIGIGLQALSIASKGDSAQAAQTLRELSAIGLRELVPAPGNDAPALSEAAAACVGLLAGVPRGMQVLAQMLRAEQTAPSREQREAAQVYLRAGQLHAHTDEAQDAQRTWLAAAQAGAQHVLHGASPSHGLQAATQMQRSAFHALRNGYESTADGSPYAQVNASLQMFAQWARAGSASAPRGQLNPLHALQLGTRVGAAEALPTPARRAGEELRKAAAHLTAWLSERRHAQRAAGQMPAPQELALQALAEFVHWSPAEQDLTRLAFSPKLLRDIERRALDLQRHAARSARNDPAGSTAACHPAVAAAWSALRAGGMRLPDTMRLLQRGLLDHREQAAAGADENTLESAERQRFHQAVASASRLLHDGDSARVRSPEALFDALRDLLAHLAWRDKLRITEQRVLGLNAAPLSAALAVIPAGLGLKLALGGQASTEASMEIYMGRTGLSLQIGRQATRQLQAAAGISAGLLLPGTDAAPVVLGGTAEWRLKMESSLENGVQIRVPRRGKGHELEQRAQFLAMFEHLLRLAGAPDSEGVPLAQRDLLGELLAQHPSITVGVIDGAQRTASSTESSIAATAGVRVGEMDGRPRRVTLGASVGVKARSESASSQTPIAGYMNMLLKDSTAQSRVELAARASASVVAQQWHRPTVADAAPTPVARLSTGTLELGFSKELHSAGSTTFTTLWMFNNEIDPVRTDRGFEFQSFAQFERDVRRNWPLWTNYGVAKLRGKVDEQRLYLVAERQLEDFMDRVRVHMRDNRFASLIVDWVLQSEAAPRLDALRAQSQLLRMAGREAEAAQTERDFDALLQQPAIWEPTMLILREKGKRQRERGIDFFVKRQTNQMAEAMRTVGQWTPYEPVP